MSELLRECGPAAWVWQVRTRNAAIVDVAWAAVLGLLAVGFALAGPGDEVRRTILGLGVGAWSARLSVHLFVRGVWRRPEEARYRRLRAALAPRENAGFLLVFLAQAVLDLLLALPFALAAASPAPIGILDGLAVAILAIAIGGEAIADRQLARFLRREGGSGRTCREGLWRYSRHPNYFFEWLVWCGFALLASSAEGGVWAWTAPLLMYVLVTRVTGIPPAERGSRERRSDYADYQATTSAFFPWFPRESPTESTP